MNDTTDTGLVSVEEYLRIEEVSPIKHESVSGVLYAMMGGTKAHSEILGNIYAAIRPEARRNRCRIFPGDVKAQVDAERIYYPDLIVACDPDDRDPLITRNPCLVVEILSPSTQSIDRREKASTYRTIASLRSYLIVDQDEMRVEHYYRNDDDAWTLEFVTEGAVTLRCPPMELWLDDIYEELPQAE
ncbi:MAG TPA: Uma2 family endonuclease [Thermomicrobiales bacterium]|nr:Uma2 family endonuclease [Thermomicrobiales bacterium]